MSCTRFALGAGVLVLGASCIGGEEVDGPGALVLDESGVGVAGSFQDGPEAVRIEFRSERVAEDVVEIDIELPGTLLWFLVDRRGGVIEVDGYGPEHGEDRQVTAAERTLLLGLSRALDELGPGVPTEIALLRDLASHWSEFPSGMEMQQAIFLPQERGAASLCERLDSYVRGTHDGWWEFNWSDRTTLDGVYLSLHGPCRAVEDQDTQATSWWVGSWQCLQSEPDHSTAIEYAYGDCFGRCGAGCGVGSVFSWSCVDHDLCNRFGHTWTASVPGGHCADEFAAAAAELVSEPHCL